jgi:hypothetical protein
MLTVIAARKTLAVWSGRECPGGFPRAEAAPILGRAAPEPRVGNHVGFRAEIWLLADRSIPNSSTGHPLRQIASPS